MLSELLQISPRRIAILKPSALGDIVHALPVATALRDRFPQARLVWIVNRVYAPLIEGHPDLDGVLSFDRGMIRGDALAGLAGCARFLRELRRRQFDLVIDLQGLLRSGVIAWATGARIRLGLSSAREGARFAYTHLLPDALPTMHAVDRYWLAAQALGAARHEKRFRFPNHPLVEAWAAALLHGLSRPLIAINLGTRWETKRWPVTYFARLANWSVARFGGCVLLVGGRDESALGDDFCRQTPALNLIGQTTLPQLVAVLRRADVLLSNDSGPLHLAAALGCRVLAPYTCTAPLRTGPYNQPQSAIATTVPCAASYRKKCGNMVCRGELTPERLWPRLQELLQSWQLRSA